MKGIINNTEKLKEKETVQITISILSFIINKLKGTFYLKSIFNSSLFTIRVSFSAYNYSLISFHYKKALTFIFLLFFFHFSYAQQLESYIKEAEQNNPQIQAFELRYAIANEKTNEVSNIPNTQFSAGYFVSEPETRTGAQRAKFSVQQMLPWFGTITARKNYVTSIAETEYVDITILKRKLALSVSTSFYQLFSLYKKQKILEDNIGLLKTYEKLALTSVEVGKASAVDVLKLQIRQNELKQKKEILEQEYLSEVAVFNSFLNRKSNLEIVLPTEMNLPVTNFRIDEEDLSLNPELLKYDKLYESIQQSELLNQKERAPQIGFGLDYVPVSQRSDVMMSDNGKDIIMPMVFVSIPVFNKKYNSKTRQNELRQQEIEAEKNEKHNQLKVLLAKAISTMNIAKIQFKTQQENLIQTKNAEQILIKNYETGTVNFNDILDIQELQLKFKTQQIESIQLFYIQAAIHNYLTN
ncbi:TolC family protein [Aquimarina muelleri]|uniref:Outer membrane protein TolC n=1 Tax=Aquimarina muelleri TaxID=279356 RepID=A0A918JSA9_9FLAO|nr:TolC family protein [Aquimarina muelleri]MCX2763460.1 TolC family protein [Aquimarina muelleri]GGX02546.1 hypothetical protein GCM10007384_00330 [Aquimarina muelleri]